MSTPSPLSPVVGEAQAPPVERFRKRPLEVEMMLWDGTVDRADELFTWAGGYFRTVNGVAEVYNNQEHGWIPCPLGHRVAKGALGEFYPVSPAAIAGTFDPAPEPLELTEVEKAAAARSEHMSTCHEEACVECMRELRVIRRIVKAIRPHIEKPLKERLEAAELVCHLLGITSRGGPETDRGKAVEQAWMDWCNGYRTRHVRPADLPIAELAARRDEIRDRTLAAIRAEREDGIDSDLPPVAAASIPTPIPDGEREI